eukprot:6084342-Pyramimonas_sp.AAC.1
MIGLRHRDVDMLANALLRGLQGCMAPPSHVCNHLTTFVAPQGAPPKALMAGPAWRRRPMSARPSRGSRPHREHRRRPRWP